MLPPVHKSSYTPAAASLTGFASNVTGATWAISVAGPADGMAHKVTLRNDSATDHSAKTVIYVGTDANDNALTETINMPAGSATVTSTKFFKTLTSATPSATIGADTMDIGWAVTAVTPWVKMDYVQNAFSASVAVDLVSGTLNYDVEHCYDYPNGSATAFKHTNITASTAKDHDGYNTPVQGVRVNVNSQTSAVFTFFAIQGDRS